jgi:protein-S-isoprenylcysteine O-methyltransferase Ste14
MRPGLVIIALWIGWALSWIAASGWRTDAVKRAGGAAELTYRLVSFLGGVILAIPAHGYEGPLRLWHIGPGVWLCIAAEAAGFAFCWWARIHLGKLWSGEVTLKPDHHVVDSGPYAIVRHPIYTGILLAALATMAAKGTIPGVLGALLLVVGLWLKARLEENFLRQELGAEAYDSYRRRVPMLVPFGPKAK